MHVLASILLVLFFILAADAQNVKPEIVGQKDLSTKQSQPITIKLTDLYVEETAVDTEQDDDKDADEDQDDDKDDHDEGDGNGKDDDKDDKDNKEDNDDKGKDDKDKGNKGNKGDKDDKKNKGDKKDKNGNKDKGKGNKNDKGGGSNGRTFPEGYTLVVFSGEDYTLSGSTVTPDANFTGVLVVKVQVKNETYSSNTYNLKITVLPDPQTLENLPPVITGQKPVSTKKDKAVTLKFSDLVVSDPDDTYPEGFSLRLMSGTNYSIAGATVTPAMGFIGTLTVQTVVNDGKDDSQPYDVNITVTSGNVPPVITGQVPLSTSKNKPLTLQLSDLKVTDPDNRYPSGFTLKISSGERYSVSGAVITPLKDFTGILQVKVVVNDGTDDSEPYELKVDVLDNKNIAPAITGQIPLSISKNQPITLVLFHLKVTDPDNRFPDDFTLTVFPGNNYTFSNTTVKPDADFSGDLFVKISVHDGKASSEVYDLKITVTAGVNIKPVISGQTGLKIVQGQSLEVKLSHIVVVDPDNKFPEDFSMNILDGDHYSVQDHRITPAQNFLGLLDVGITVNDGHTSSDPFNLKVQVVPKNRLEIIGQKNLYVPEDSSLTLKLSDLLVNDPGNTYPAGFAFQILEGENYKTANGMIIPVADFFGNLTVSVQVSKGGSASAPFSLLVVVTPVNDPPALVNLEEEPLVITGAGPWVVTSAAEVMDPDDEHLLFSEVAFDPGSYEPEKDELQFEHHENIHAVFDPAPGILFLLGKATSREYQELFRSLRYRYGVAADSVGEHKSKKIYFRINDGKDTSITYERVLLLETEVALEIPTAFTPNNDQANDTWKITPVRNEDGFSAFIRVYDKRGNMVFESNRLEIEWDGQFNGSPLPADVYFYTIEMDLSYTKINYKGIVSILR
jgi:gliding motility-associated-like protein